MNTSFSFDRHGYRIDGKRQFLISGELHYFRIPECEWKKRLNLMKKTGINCLATYVPWCVHEPQDGTILFDDCEERNLTAFLSLAQQQGFKVILRPGPLQYSELIADGVPMWLYEHYPETHAKRRDGSDFLNPPVFSYLSPTFLKRSKRYYQAFCKVVTPFLVSNGGPVVMIQLDNELAGAQIWRGSLDYNPVSMEFGKPGGRYPVFLEHRYQTIDALNIAYGTAYADFTSVRPTGSENEIASDDYYDFYCSAICDYIGKLRQWLLENSVTVPVCHNAGSPSLVPMLQDIKKLLGKDFLLGVDSYYQLNYKSGKMTPTPGYFAEDVLFGADMLEAYGNPYTVLEIQAGSFADIPPLMPKPLESFYMCHLAAGLKGVNYYIFAGGKNSGQYGATGNVYDYHACVSAEGKKRPIYRTVRRFSRLMQKNNWLCEADPVGTVRVGVESELLRREKNPGHSAGYRTQVVDCLLYTLMMTKYAPRYFDLANSLPTDQPLLLYRSERMSRDAQQNVIDFVIKGGTLILVGGVAKKDENGISCTLLSDFLAIETAPNDSFSPITYLGTTPFYCVRSKEKIVRFGQNDRPFLRDGIRQNILGIRGKRGAGEIVYIASDWNTALLSHKNFLESILESVHATPLLSCDNPSIIWRIRENSDKKAIFLMNLHHGSQKAKVTLYENGTAKDLGTYTLKPLEVRMLVRKIH